MKYSIILISITTVLFYSFYDNKKNILFPDVQIRNNTIDTFLVSDSILQIVRMKNGRIYSLELINKKENKGEYVIHQTIDFHENGVISEVFMLNGQEEIKKKNNDILYSYQMNVVEIDTNGGLVSGSFMKDFKVISKYKSKK